MATVNLTTTPAQLDDGTAAKLEITNSGGVDAVILRAGGIVSRLRPTQNVTVFPEGSVVTAATAAGSGSVAVTTTAPTPAPTVSIPDATSSVKGAVQLTGALGGTAASPTVPGLTAKANLTGGNTWTGAQDFTGATVTGVAGASFTGCKATSSATPSLTNATATTIALATEEWDTNTFHDLVTNNTRVTIPTGLGGKYSVTASITYGGNATGRRLVRIVKNGTNVVGRGEGTPGHASVMAVNGVGVIDMAAGDYLELVGYQDSGGSLALATGIFTDGAGGTLSAFLSVHRLG